MTSKVTATGMIVSTPPDHTEKLLIVEIKVECPECGDKTFRIPGHHLKAFREICQSYCDQFPELTKGSIQLLNQYSFQGEIPKRPEDN